MLLTAEQELAQGCISDLVFDAWLANELDASRAHALAQHARGCVRCAARERELRAQAQHYLARGDYEQGVARLSASLAARRERRRLPWFLSVSAAAAAALALWLQPPASDTRRKGSESVGFYVRRAGALFRGQPGQRVRPGDQLRFTWRSDQPAYLAILSLDAQRVVSTYFPGAGAQQLIVPSGAEVELPSAVELDQTLGPEQVFVVSCPTAPDLARLRRTLAMTGRVSAPAGCRVSELALFKEPPS